MNTCPCGIARSDCTYHAYPTVDARQPDMVEYQSHECPGCHGHHATIDKPGLTPSIICQGATVWLKPYRLLYSIP